VSVIFQCPIAGGEVRTDIKADRAMLAKNRNVRLYVRCECCGAEHRFSAKEGALEAA
jgi:RNase P subunit RPR2